MYDHQAGNNHEQQVTVFSPPNICEHIRLSCLAMCLRVSKAPDSEAQRNDEGNGIGGQARHQLHRSGIAHVPTTSNVEHGNGPSRRIRRSKHDTFIAERFPNHSSPFSFL
jgi:hypothetical protein